MFTTPQIVRMRDLLWLPDTATRDNEPSPAPGYRPNREQRRRLGARRTRRGKLAPTIKGRR
jgi:hypothetical protein